MMAKRRAKPGTRGKGGYYHIVVRPSSEFVTFRAHDVGKKGGILRLAGQRENGSWDDQKWLISKQYAHVTNGKLVPDTAEARKILKALGSTPTQIKADRFRAKPRRNIPEREKPTAAQKRAHKKNIRKAQLAWHK